MSQLARARVTPWRCRCGCASISFSIDGQSAPNVGLRPLAEFVFATDGALSGIFVYEKAGVLSGLEVYGLAGDAPTSLPVPDELRPFYDTSANA
ncbi:MAG: hypothetical protein PHC88_16885 [Terrimicrobiaceae bacterium]|nr:hypothetical protein [Terrimicrobiaceae bacterium]